MAQLHYGVIAKKPGTSRDLKFLHSCGFHETPEAAIGAVRNRLVGDHNFRKRWSGHQILPVVVDFFVSVEANGSIVMHLNDKDPVRHA